MAFSSPCTDEDLHIAVQAVKTHGTQVAAAAALNIPRGTLQGRLREASRRGLMLDHPPAMPGFEIKEVSTGPDGKQHIRQIQERGAEFEVPAGHHVKGVSALVDAEGRTIQQWIKTREGQLDPLQLAEHIAAKFAKFKPAAVPSAAPRNYSDDSLTVVPLNDWHLNMMAWGKEVGGPNWDLKIAERAIGAGVEDVICRSPASAECVLLGGGDLLHADTKRNETANGTRQDTDGRYQKGVDVLCSLLIRTTDAALRRHRRVVIRILPGNHDEHSSVAITYFLAAYYRNEPRVTVDTDPSLFFWHRFGSVLIGSTHGHTVPIAKMPGIMAHRRAEDWGATRFRYVHGFHLHHSAKIATEGNGVICEIHQAPIPQDAWHFGSGFLSGRSLQAITYHRDFGEVGRVRTALLDGVE